MPQSPLFGKPLSEQHVYLPYYEGTKNRKSRCHRYRPYMLSNSCQLYHLLLFLSLSKLLLYIFVKAKMAAILI